MDAMNETIGHYVVGFNAGRRNHGWFWSDTNDITARRHGFKTKQEALDSLAYYCARFAKD